MAVAITQQPTSPNAAYTRLPYVVSGSVTVNNPQYQYVMDIYESGSSDLITRITQTKNPNGVAVFDPSRIFQGELGQDDNWKVNGSIGATNAVKTFEIKFGEQYGTSISSSVTVYPNLDSTEIKLFPGVIDPNNGVSFNFDSSTVLPINILSNTPEAQTPGPSPLTDALFVNNTDYATITIFEDETDVGILVYGENDTLLYYVDLGAQPAFTTLGVGPQNLVDNGMSGSILDSAYYIEVTVDPYDSFDLYLPNHPSHPCNEEYVRFAFINAYGFWDYYNVYNPVRRQSNIERQSVTLPQVDYSSITSPYDVNRRGQKDYYIDKKDTFEVTTDYLDKEVGNWLEEMLESPSVYVQRGNCFIPIIITNSQYQHNNSTSRNKLFQYTIQFEPANQPYGDWDQIPTACIDVPEVITPTPTPSPTPTSTPIPAPTDTPTPTPTSTGTPTPTPTSGPVTPTPTPTNTPTPTPTPTPETFYDILKINNIGSQNISGLTTQQIIDLQCSPCDGPSNGSGYKVLNVPMQVGDQLYDALLDPITTYNGNLASNDTAPGSSVGACAGDNKLRVTYIYEITNGIVQSITGPQSTDCSVTPTPTPTNTPTPTPTSTPTPTPTPAPLGCYTYSVENNDQTFTVTIEYNDCDGNGQSFILQADTATPDFCAEEGSVRRQSGSFNFIIYEEATTCP